MVSIVPVNKVISSSPGGILAAVFRDLESGEGLDNVSSRERLIEARINKSNDMSPSDISTAKGNIRKALLSPSITVKVMAKLIYIIGFDSFRLGVDIHDGDKLTTSEFVELELDDEGSATADRCLVELINKIYATLKEVKPSKASKMSIKEFTKGMKSKGVNNFEMWVGVANRQKPRGIKTYGIKVAIGE